MNRGSFKHGMKGSTPQGSKPSKTRTMGTTVNTSLDDMSCISNQLEDLCEEMKTMRGDLNMIMKRDEMETFIKDTISKAISEMNENMEMSIAMKVEEKTKELQNQIQTLENENEKLSREISNMTRQMKISGENMKEAEKRSKLALIMTNYNEQYSRKHNIKIIGVGETQEESEEILTTKICEILQSQEVTLSPSKIQTIHRIPGKPNLPRPVLNKRQQ